MSNIEQPVIIGVRNTIEVEVSTQEIMEWHELVGLQFKLTPDEVRIAIQYLKNLIASRPKK